MNNDYEDDNDDSESSNDEDDKKSREDYEEPDDTVRTDCNRLAGNKRKYGGTNGDNLQKKVKSTNLNNSWEYAALTTENLLKYQQLIK